MSDFEKTGEVLHSLPNRATEFCYGVLNSVEGFGEKIRQRTLGRLALVSSEATMLALSFAGGAKAADGAPVDGSPVLPAPTIEQCAYEATHPDYLTTPGARYQKGSLTKLKVSSIDVPALNPGCAELGDRGVDVFAQTRGKRGNWGRYSNVAMIDDNSKNTWQATLTTKPFKPIPGPANRLIRLASVYSFTPNGTDEAISRKGYYGKPLKYGPGGDGR
jgi:hypothetical protein